MLQRHDTASQKYMCVHGRSENQQETKRQMNERMNQRTSKRANKRTRMYVCYTGYGLMLILLLLVVAAAAAAVVGNEINTSIFHMKMLYHCGSLAEQNGKYYGQYWPYISIKRCFYSRRSKPF